MNATRIEWTDYTWNPVTGCTAVSEGCRNCYARRMSHRLRGRFGYPADEPFRVTLHPERLEEPLRLRKPSRIFVCSMGDLFHEEVPIGFIAEVFNIMACATTDCGKRHKHSAECWGGSPHTFIILTKRAERMKQVLDDLPCWVGENWPGDLPLQVSLGVGLWPLPNVCLGVTCENQATADERIPLLLQTPAAVRWVSVEPYLALVDISPYLGETPCKSREDGLHCECWYDGSKCCACGQYGGLDWIVCGGETGPCARPMHPDWVRSLRDQAIAAGMPFFFKGWGEWVSPYARRGEFEDLRGEREHFFSDGIGTNVVRVGRQAAGRLLDGRTWDGYPRGQRTCDATSVNKASSS